MPGEYEQWGILDSIISATREYTRYYCLVLRSTRLHDVRKRMLLYGSWQNDSDIIVSISEYMKLCIFHYISRNIHGRLFVYRYIFVFIKTLFIRCSSEFSSSQLFRSLFLVWGSRFFACNLLELWRKWKMV